jgi:hypothetical protein
MPETDLHIAERLKKLLPPLTPEERKQLKENIESDGKVLDKILFWHDGQRNVVCDGMHRWEIVRGTEIPYTTGELKFADYEAAEIWILDHQLGRRNLLKPADIRKVRGELYNRIKRQDGGHGDQIAGDQNDTPPLTAAEKVAEKAGVSTATVKRDGARVAVMEKLTKAAQAIADKATEAEVKALAKLDEGSQDMVARAVRTGQAKSVKEAMKLTGAKPPATAKVGGSGGGGNAAPKKNSREFWFKQWERSIGPLVRLVNSIAENIGEKHSTRHVSVKKALETATQEMICWMGVKK